MLEAVEGAQAALAELHAGVHDAVEQLLGDGGVEAPEGVRLKLCSESPTPPRRSRMGATSSVMARTASSVVRGRGFSR